MKRFLKENDVDYEYVDVDLCTSDDRQKIKEDILNRGGRLSYPTLVIDDRVLITGYQEDEVRKNLDI
jgi:glutaredoxin